MTTTVKRSITAGIAAGLGLFTAFVLSLASSSTAIGEGQIEGGNFYRLRNVTKNTAFSDPASADKCETVQYRIRLHNPGPTPVTNVNVRASLPAAAMTTNVSTATVTAQNAEPPTVSDTATLHLTSALRVAYESGSTQLLNASGGVISNLPDGITQGGVNIGTVGVSLQEIKFVQFKAKIECPQPPPPPQKSFKCEALNVKQVSRTRFDFTAVARVQNVTIQNYVFTARNEAGNTVDSRTVTTSATTADYQFNQSTPGTYNVSVIINTSEGATNPNDCKRQIKVVKEGETPPPVTPPSQPPQQPPIVQQQQQQQSTVVTGGQGGVTAAPEVLPATGPADTAAIFGLVSTLSSVGYYLVMRRFN